MTLTIELPPEIEAGLVAQAQAQGLDVSLYVQDLLCGQLLDTETFPILSDEAMSRESIYEDRGL